jgi:aminoglycoside phosphotransferase (APT) family kinase protein
MIDLARTAALTKAITGPPLGPVAVSARREEAGTPLVSERRRGWAEPAKCARVHGYARAVSVLMQRDEINATLVTGLLQEQFPHWAELPVVEVVPGGWDNRTFRLGSDLSVRLPSAESYAGAVEKELTWLPRLAAALPVAIPVAVAAGRPSPRYPWPWSVRRWLPGRPATRETVGGSLEFAEELAEFLVALQRVNANGGPSAGRQSFYRGADVGVYDEGCRRAIDILGDPVSRADALAVWKAARESRWDGDPVWFHGDVAAGNLLVRDGHLSAVIDFGTCGVGDPACDLVIMWTLLDDAAGAAFRTGLGASDETWARARGWALWKALITAADSQDEAVIGTALQTIALVIEDHLRPRP